LRPIEAYRSALAMREAADFIENHRHGRVSA